MDVKKDVFICHASEDKQEIARPLAEACEAASISCWLDEAEIQWGDSITEKVNEGLSKCRFVVVVFSAAFAQKNWPQREFNAVINQEATSGKIKVLPLLVGTDSEKEEILEKFPLVNDKRYLPWDGDLREIVSALRSRLGPSVDKSHKEATGAVRAPGLRIPLPEIKKQFTQRDKDLFLRNAFPIVKDYFQKALQELEGNYQEVQTDFAEVHTFKFISTIYLRGEVANRCKIWLGGFSSSDSIAYQAGKFSIDSDNSVNDYLSISDDEQSLGFLSSGMGFLSNRNNENEHMSAQQAAEYLWKRFTDNLG